MKKTKRLILLAAAAISFQFVSAQVRSQDSMIHKIFATLKAKDEKAFIALYPNSAQFSKMMRTMMGVMLNSEQMQQMMAADEKSKNLNIDSLIDAEVAKLSKPEAFAEMEKSFARSFNKIIEKGESKGVNWNEATLVTYTIDTTAQLDEELELLKSTGFKAMKGVIDFKSAGTDYQMSFDKVMFLPDEGGWFGGEFPALAKKGESLEPDDDPADSGIDSVAVETPKAQEKVKSKTKTPTSKTKTKTKTPARKTKS